MSYSRRERKARAVKYKGGECHVCSYNKCFSALTFHHIDPLSKSFNISQNFGVYSWNKIKKELDKCILLCSNCHYEIHEGLIDGKNVVE